MGREATCPAQVGPERAEVKALLESTELILRGAIKRRYRVAELRDVRVAGGALHFQVGGETVALRLGVEQSQSWATKIKTPPPSLAAKLGVGPTQRAFVCGVVDDAALVQALQTATTTDAKSAHVLLAVLRNEADLSNAIKTHARMGCPAMWVVYRKGEGKGKAAALGDTQVRQTLRAQGYMDNKTAAVSDTLTATRYARA
jgi:hypothetical protein